MPKREIYQKLLSVCSLRGGGFMLLIDPDRARPPELIELIESAEESGVDAILVGASFMFSDKFSDSVREIKELTSLPVILFPGGAGQVTPHADAILFMSLISGRNPQYLIEEQVRAAPMVKACGIEPIATAYMLIESGSYTTVEYVSNTRPIPRSKGDLAVAHALAAEAMGMKMVYLEAGSGARLSVPDEMVKAVSANIEIPIIVGGGITTPEEAALKISAGASFVVVGTRFESPGDTNRLREFADACHPATVLNPK